MGMTQKHFLPLEICERYEAGQIMEELAQEFQCSVSTIKRFLIKHNISIRGRGTTQSGCMNPSWKGGESRSTKRRYAKEVLDLHGVDQYTCQQCGYKSELRLNIHHKDGFKHNHSIDNLKVLCPSCHAKEHSKERDASGRFI